MMRALMAATLIGALGLSAALKGGRYEEESRQDEPSIMMLKVDGRANATPWVAARGSFVAITWGATAAGKTDVYVVVSRDGGGSFATPVRVSRDGDARLGGEMPPRVALGLATAGGTPDIAVAWGVRRAEALRTEIRMARSRDGGRTFQPATALQASGAKGDRGWHALAVDDRGTAHVVWLDHRGMATRAPGEHDHHKAGDEMAQLSSLYYVRMDGAPVVPPAPLTARPSDQRVVLVRQGTATERELLKGVCYCCKTALATGAEGRVYAAWRHVYPGNIRDIAFTMSRDGGRTFDAAGRVSRDEWQIAGCPDDGPAMTVGGDGTVHIVWPTVLGGNDPEGALFYASTRDGKTFTPRQRVPTLGSPKPGHPQIALASNGQPVIAWDEIVSGVRRAAMVAARVDANGAATFGKPQTLTTDAASIYPMLVPTTNGMLAVWTSGPAATSVIALKRLDPR